jgi:hypothetical protein
MAAIVIKPSQLGSALRGEARKVAGAIERGAIRGAHRGKAHLIAETDRKGITDMGQYRGSFQVFRGKIGPGRSALASIENHAPIAGIVELGARPHPVSKEGIEAIARWVQRKLGIVGVHGPVQQKVNAKTGKVTFKQPRKFVDITDEAMQIANAIAWKIRHHGQEGRFVFAEAKPQIERYFREEVERILREPPRGKGGAP